MEIVIKYKKNRKLFNLVMSILWFVLAVTVIVLDGTHSWSTWIWMVMGSLYIATYINNYLKDYLTLKDGQIIENAFFGKKINLNEVVSFKALFGDYILKTKDREMIINTQLIDESSLETLNQYLSKYDNVKLA